MEQVYHFRKSGNQLMS